jgi:uncharacterized protein (DUF2141 family)
VLVAGVLLAARWSAAAGANGSGTLVVEVTGFKHDRGQLLLRLFDGERGYPTDGARAVRETKQSISGGHARIELSGLAFGEYAIACVHDENGDGKLNTGLFGIPKEGVCASNDARGHMGPPSWKDAHFSFKRDGTVIRIHMQYR